MLSGLSFKQFGALVDWRLNESTATCEGLMNVAVLHRRKEAIVLFLLSAG